MEGIICKSRSNNIVMAISRTNKNTLVIGMKNNIRKHITFSNREFDRLYKPIEYWPALAAELWLQSTITMTGRVRRELQMVITIFRKRVVERVTKLENSQFEAGAKGVTQLNGKQDLEGRSMKQLITIYNAAFPKDERVTVLPDVEGDINAAMKLVWSTLKSAEIYVKPERSSGEGRKNIFYKLERMPSDDEKIPPQAVQILSVLTEEPVEKSVLVDNLKGVLTTKQPPERIVAFYQKRLVNEGFMSMIKE